MMFSEKGIHSGNLILVNQRLPFVENQNRPCLVPACPANERVLIERHVANFLYLLMKELDGWRYITPVSGWRAREEQQEIWNRSLRENGAAFTKQFVARPGHSEHQTGLAIDLGLIQPDIDPIRPDFPYEGICQEFRERAAAYGFIERYPKGKEEITGIAQEPWHFRFVGMPHAAFMANAGFTLEEYHAMLKQDFSREKPLLWRGKTVDYTIFPWSLAEARAARLELENGTNYSVSGDNDAGYIVTVWKERRT